MRRFYWWHLLRCHTIKHSSSPLNPVVTYVTCLDCNMHWTRA